MYSRISLGATYLGDSWCQFLVWAPFVRRVELHIVSPVERIVPLKRDHQGYHRETVNDLHPGALYMYRLDGQKERPDPASRFQPKGVHGPSQIVGPHFHWEDDGWRGFALEHYIIYELHVGTFTQEGTFEATIARLEELKGMGITVIELMPVAQFPGDRNWGYDGTYPFAVQNSYGGPAGIKELINACHIRDLAVILDVVYNHLGPEGNYLLDYGPYFTDRYKTPWGAAINFDGPYSHEVRRFFIENALYWVEEYHVDALRLDAVHAILDFSATPFLEELTQTVHERAGRLNRHVHLIAESDLNDTRIVRPQALGGFGLDAQWNDDFHHGLHAILTEEKSGYYEDFGRLGDLVKAYRDGFVYSGQFSAYRKRRHGNSSRLIPARRFVVFSQNHDQVGNRMRGERLSQLITFEGLKLVAGLVLLSPFIPLLFMGEEYGETAPFPYFISHSDPDIIEAIRNGRSEEFAAFSWQGDPPDPQDEATFLSAKLNWNLRLQDPHKRLLDFHRELVRLRRGTPALASLTKEHMEVRGLERDRALLLRRWNGSTEALVIYHMAGASASVEIPVPQGQWEKRLDSTERIWHGPGTQVPKQIVSRGIANLPLSPYACVLFTKHA